MLGQCSELWFGGGMRALVSVVGKAVANKEF